MFEEKKQDFKALPEQATQETAAEKWQRENQKGIEAIKIYAEENGSFSDYQRAF